MRKIIVKRHYEYDDWEQWVEGYDLVDSPLVYDSDGDYLIYGNVHSLKIAKKVAKFLSKELK